MRGLGLLLALSLAGCAEVQEATGVATQQDLLQLRQEMMAGQQSSQRARTDADSVSAQVDKRVREQTGENERQVSTLTRQIDSLNDTVTTLSGRVDELTTKLDAVNRQLRGAAPGAGAAATTPRPAAGASGGPSGGSTPGASTGAPAGPAPGPVAAVPSRPTTGSLQPQDIYQAAYIDFSKGSYSLAIAGFREFLRRYPDHELAGSAQYWIGEAYLSLARGFAVQEFKKVQANYPRADKVPTALYKEALALLDLKQPALAQARLQYLVDNFPRAEETSLARERLTTLKNTPR